MTFDLIVPLWNEEKNIDDLVGMILRSPLRSKGLEQLILVNNGSSDQTGTLVDKWGKQYSWIKPLHLKENQNYGGGVYAGLVESRCDVVAYIPGDLQVHADDVYKIWLAYQQYAQQGDTHCLIKGRRTVRHDGFNTRLVSHVYTFLANLILRVKVKDVNGLPKLFHKDLLKHLPAEKMKNFVFDIQLIYTARKNKWPIGEIPVTFHARRQGVSSWSSKRLKTYVETLKQMLRLRTLEYPS